MQFILPSIITDVDGISNFPITIFEKDNLIIKIEFFSIKEKEKIFNIKELSFGNDSIRAKNIEDIHALSNYREYIFGLYKIVIDISSGKAAEMEKIGDIVDLVFKIIVGSGFTVYQGKGTEAFDNFVLRKNKLIISRRQNKRITLEKIDRIKKLLEILILTGVSEKIEPLKSLLDTALSYGQGIAGAFYITILESIFVPEKDAEIVYRFSMRIAKKKGKGMEYRTMIKDLYNKRSRTYHGANNSFTIEEIKFLETEVSWALESFILNQKDFEDKKLDELLLK